MTVKTGATWAGTFVTLDATGALSAGTPSGTLYVDGVANAAEVTITGSNPYKFSVTLPTLTAGQRVDMYITATISGIATAAIVASEQADTSLLSDVKTDTAAILADTGTDGVLISSGTGAKQISLDSGKVLLQATQTGVTIPTVTNLTNLPSIPNNWLTAAGIAADAGAEIADAVWDEAISGHTTAGSFGAKNQKVVPSETIGDYKADVSSLATSAALATVGSNVTSIKTKTDNLPASPAAVGSAMTLSNNAITAAVIATDAIDADSIKNDAVTKIQNGLATPTNITAGTITTVTNLTNLPAMPND